ncbi:MAG: FprA family A-type flavoprotein [Candidatus Margulisbacteria bacterium]|nr:FprA family A-type flavoprotein [Candidatus Margulisiibacteriota bacterium]
MIEIKKNVFEVGSKHFDRRLFDELIPLPDGTTYNAYIIKGFDKTALIDTVDPVKTDVLLEHLKELKISKIDYVIAHHGEQDHSGSIPAVLAKFPAAKVVTNEKCKVELMDHLLVAEDRFIVVADGEKLPLGGKTLEFIFTPWVHWPETFCTYLAEDKILFTCDFFGSHLASSEAYVVDECKVYESAKRYFAEIMMPFRSLIVKNIEKISKYDFTLIAPSHGPIYDKPKFIIDAYKDWTSDRVKNEVVFPYVSMHGSTKAMADHFVEALAKKGITVKPFNLTETDIGELAISLVDAATIVIGSPTVLAGPHPAAVYAAYLANALRPKLRYASIMGSFGWGGKTVETIKGMLTNLKVELLEPVLVKGHPKEADLKALDSLAQTVYNKHQADSLVMKGEN